VRTLRDLEQGRVVRPRGRSVQLLVEALGLAPDDADRLRAAAGPAASTGQDRRLWIGVLGALELRCGGVAVPVGSTALRCLLGLLAVQPGRVVSRDEMVEVLWPAGPPVGCANQIQVYMTRLRRLVEPDAGRESGFAVLVRAGGGYRLDLDERGSDVAAFDVLVAQARLAQVEGRLDEAGGLFGRAVACWRGPVLGGVEPRLALHPVVVGLAGRRVEAALAYAEAAGADPPVVGVLRAVAADEPLHEGLHARLMRALAAGGQQAGALQMFADIQRRLDDELGIEPGVQLREAQVRVLRQQVPAGAPGAPVEQSGGSGSSGWTRPVQLPADVAGFTGRAADLAALDALLAGADAGSVPAAVVISAIDGMAGVGKTALAVHWAHRIAERFADGVLYVNLRGWAAGAPVRPIDALAGFLRAVGVPVEQVPVDVDEAAALFRSRLAGRRVLIVLDNARDAEQVRPLLPGTPGCLVLVTSRDRLSGLVARDGARRLSLDVLAPGEARELLVGLLGTQRAAAELDAVEELARVCAYLPLALRIAAAHLTDRPRHGIAAFVAELAADRLAGLEVPGDEQAAVRAAFDVSYARLDEPARRLFRLLGLVPGPDVPVAAAAALADAPVAEVRRLLARLTGAHLLDEHRPGRYVLHDLLRVYAADRATAEDTDGDRQAALTRLYDHYLAGASTAANLLHPQMLRLPAAPLSPGPVPSSADDAAAMAWLEVERPNLVAVITHTERHGPREVAWRLADALRGYLWDSLYAVDWLTVARAAQAAATADDHAQAQAAAELNLGNYHWIQGSHWQAVDHQVRALQLARRAGWTDGESAALVNLGSLHGILGELAQATEHLADGVALARRAGDIGGEAVGLSSLGFVGYQQGRLEQAADHHDQALTLHRRLGSRTGQAMALDLLGTVHYLRGRLEQAEDCLAQGFALHREVGTRESEPGNRGFLALVHAAAGRRQQALDLVGDALTVIRETGNRISEETGTLIASATVHHRFGDHVQAVDHYRQGLRLARDTGYRYLETEALLGLADALTALDEPHPALIPAGYGLTLARTAGFRLLEGRAHTTLATVHHHLNNPARATDHAHKALALHAETGHRPGAARTHLLLGHVLHDLGDPHAATGHWQQALALFTDIGTPDADHVRTLLAPTAHTNPRARSG
jgi:DNA-binding SARP family transcriptional activator/tetratricopeptide (TPR) repeat protein